MSTPITIADPNATPSLAQDTRNVDVIFGDRQIGVGTMTTAASGIVVNAHYQWPPDAPAEVRATFVFDILSSNTCKVEVDWPGLLSQRIPLQDASYIMLLLMARPDFVIATPGGDRVTVTGYVVTPVVGWISYPYAFAPNPDEVALVLELPLGAFQQPPRSRTLLGEGFRRLVLAFEVDGHLHSISEITGYHIQALDGEIGHVDDFVAGHSMATFAELVEVVGDA